MAILSEVSLGMWVAFVASVPEQKEVYRRARILLHAYVATSKRQAYWPELKRHESQLQSHSGRGSAELETVAEAVSWPQWHLAATAVLFSSEEP